MHFESVSISAWRNFENVRLDIPIESKLVCLVGENGAGKSNILELLSMAAHIFGITSGIDLPRGDPRSEPHKAEIVLRYTGDTGDHITATTRERQGDTSRGWDGSLTLRTTRGSQAVVANGIEEPAIAAQVARQAVQVCQENRQEVRHLYLDANRSYPPQPVQLQEWVQAMQQDILAPAFLHQQAARSSKTMYGEWVKYMLTLEQQSAAQHVQQIRRAREAGDELPTFSDPFSSYANELAKVLPHVRFSGVDTQARTISFDTSGQELPFDALSGGEKEIAFLIGQIERFKLRSGLLFVDEPELHLNPDLLRIWVTYLRESVYEGQVWLATHSAEAVEVIPQEAVFVLSRRPLSRTVDSAISLASRPLLATLAATVGAPAFSLQDLQFVFVEGETGRGERERFAKLCGRPLRTRFLEMGGCRAVIDRLHFAQTFSGELPQEVRFKGIVDRDFRSPEAARDLERGHGIHVLRVDEVENMFLQPELLVRLASKAGLGNQPLQFLQEASDRFAGLWVIRRATLYNDDIPPPSRATRTSASQLTWSSFSSQPEKAVGTLLQTFQHGNESQDVIRQALTGAVHEYGSMRVALDRIWKECLGKECLVLLASRLGFSGAGFMEQHAVDLWNSGDVPISGPLGMLRSYVAG